MNLIQGAFFMRPLGNSIGVWAKPKQRLWGDDGDQVSFNALGSSDQYCSEHHQTQDIRSEDITSYSAYEGIHKNKLHTLIPQFTGTQSAGSQFWMLAAVEDVKGWLSQSSIIYWNYTASLYCCEPGTWISSVLNMFSFLKENEFIVYSFRVNSTTETVQGQEC